MLKRHSISRQIRRLRRKVSGFLDTLSRFFKRDRAAIRVGRWGERIALRHITRQGLRLIKTNWRTTTGEVDIIALDRRILVAIEVKTRHINLRESYPAIEAVTAEKRARLNSLTRSFMRNHGPLCRRYAIKLARIDAIEVYYTRTRLGMFRLREIRWHRYISPRTGSPFGNSPPSNAEQTPIPH